MEFRIFDLWLYRRMGSLRRFLGEVREGEALYQIVRKNRAVRVVEVRPGPSFSGAFLAEAVPREGGKVITLLTNGGAADPNDFVPDALKKRWTIRRASAGGHLADVPDGSADVVVVAGPTESWYDEAWRVLRVGGVVSVDGRAWTVHSKGERPEL